MFINPEAISHPTTRSYLSPVTAEAKVKEFLTEEQLKGLHWFIAKTVDDRYTPVFFIKSGFAPTPIGVIIANKGWYVFN